MALDLNKIGFPLFGYDGSRTNARAIPVDSTFKTTKNEFAPSFTYNAQVSLADTARYLEQTYGLQTDGQYSQAGQVNPQSTTNLLNYGQQTYAPSTQINYDNVVDQYQALYNQLSVSDANYDTLVASGQFSINNGALGISVTTDGTNVTGVSLDPYNQDLQNGNALNNIQTLDRTAISTGLTAKGSDPIVASDINKLTDKAVKPVTSQAVVPQEPVTTNPLLLRDDSKIQQLFGGLGQNTGITPKEASDNPLLAALLKSQPKAIPTPVIGIDSTLKPQQSRQVAVVNAALDVQFSDAHKENLSLLKDTMAQSAMRAVPKNAVDARLQTGMPNPFAQVSQASANSNAGWSQGSQNQLNASADSLDKKSSGGYIPFNMGSGSSSAGQQHAHQQRRPLSAIA